MCKQQALLAHPLFPWAAIPSILLLKAEARSHCGQALPLSVPHIHLFTESGPVFRSSLSHAPLLLKLPSCRQEWFVSTWLVDSDTARASNGLLHKKWHKPETPSPWALLQKQYQQATFPAGRKSQHSTIDNKERCGPGMAEKVQTQDAENKPGREVVRSQQSIHSPLCVRQSPQKPGLGV